MVIEILIEEFDSGLLIGKELVLEHIGTFIDILKGFAYPNVRRIKRKTQNIT